MDGRGTITRSPSRCFRMAGRHFQPRSSVPERGVRFSSARGITTKVLLSDHEMRRRNEGSPAMGVANDEGRPLKHLTLVGFVSYNALSRCAITDIEWPHVRSARHMWPADRNTRINWDTSGSRGMLLRLAVGAGQVEHRLALGRRRDLQIPEQVTAFLTRCLETVRAGRNAVELVRLAQLQAL